MAINKILPVLRAQFEGPCELPNKVIWLKIANGFVDHVSFFTDSKITLVWVSASRVQRNNHFCWVQRFRRSCKQFPTCCEPKGMAQNCEAEAENISCCVMTRMVNPVGPTAVVHITPSPFWTKTRLECFLVGRTLQGYEVLWERKSIMYVVTL